MKGKTFRKALVSAVACVLAAAFTTVPSFSYMKEITGYNDSVVSSKGSWKVTLDTAHNDEVNACLKLEFIAHIEGDIEKYEREKAAGFYEDVPENGEPVPFEDFMGQIGINAPEFISFSYDSLAANNGNSTTAGVKKLTDGRFLFTADLSTYVVSGSEYGTAMSFDSWGNKSTDYMIAVDETYLYAADGSVVVHYDAVGTPDYDHEAFVAEEAAEQEQPAAAVTTTTAAQEAAAEEPAESGESADAPAETTASTTSAAPSEIKPVQVSTDFGSRDVTLLIVGIAASVVVIAVGVAIIIFIRKKNG